MRKKNLMCAGEKITDGIIEMISSLVIGFQDIKIKKMAPRYGSCCEWEGSEGSREERRFHNVLLFEIRFHIVRLMQK